IVKQLGAGFPAVAGTSELRVMRAEVGRIDSRAVRREQLADASLYRSVVLKTVQTAADSGLIGDHNDEKSAGVETADRFGSSAKQLGLAGIVHVTAVFDDRAVAIEKDCSISHVAPRLPYR